MTCEESVTRNVVPSGAERATAPVPTVPPAPLRFSIRIGCPSPSETRGCRSRETRSMLPPGGNGTTQRIGFAGHSWAAAAVTVKRSRKRALFMVLVSLAPCAAYCPKRRVYCPKPHGCIVGRSEFGAPRGRRLYQCRVHGALVRALEVRLGERPGPPRGRRARGVLSFRYRGTLQGAAGRQPGSARGCGRRSGPVLEGREAPDGQRPSPRAGGGRDSDQRRCRDQH